MAYDSCIDQITMQWWEREADHKLFVVKLSMFVIVCHRNIYLIYILLYAELIEYELFDLLEHHIFVLWGLDRDFGWLLCLILQSTI